MLRTPGKKAALALELNRFLFEDGHEKDLTAYPTFDQRSDVAILAQGSYDKVHAELVLAQNWIVETVGEAGDVTRVDVVVTSESAPEEALFSGYVTFKVRKKDA